MRTATAKPDQIARGFGVRLRRAAAALGLALAAAATALEPASARISLIRDSEIESTLKRLTAPIFSAAGVPLESVPLFIVNDDSINAFVAAGGRTMFFHTGLLRTLEEPEELMGVIAHETGHITGGHIVRRVEAIRDARRQSILATILGIGVGVAAGDGGAGVATVGAGANIAARELLKFSRGQEASADQAALQFMNRAGVDPSGLLSVLERLRQQNAIFLGGNLDPYALTHPLSSERIALLKNGVERSPARGKKVSDELRYWHGRMRAKLDGFLGRISTDGIGYGSPELDLYREAIALHRLPDPPRAIEAVDRLIAMRPNDPYYWELKGQILAESGRGPEAVAPYRKALQLAPHEPLIAGGLGEALLTMDNAKATAEALRVLEKAALADRFDARLRRPLAIAYARSGREGMAAVVTAERLALLGNLRDAGLQARRAQALLPNGSPGWLRADDIIALAPR